MSSDIIFQNGQFSDGSAILYKIIDMVTDSKRQTTDALVVSVGNKPSYYSVYGLQLDTEQMKGYWNASDHLGFTDNISVEDAQFTFYQKHLQDFIRKLDIYRITDEINIQLILDGGLEDYIKEHVDPDFKLPLEINSIEQLTDESTFNRIIESITDQVIGISEKETMSKVIDDFLNENAVSIYENLTVSNSLRR